MASGSTVASPLDQNVVNAMRGDKSWMQIISVASEIAEIGLVLFLLLRRLSAKIFEFPLPHGEVSRIVCFCLNPDSQPHDQDSQPHDQIFCRCDRRPLKHPQGSILKTLAAEDRPGDQSVSTFRLRQYGASRGYRRRPLGEETAICSWREFAPVR
jgi:hypothetical protein